MQPPDDRPPTVDADYRLVRGPWPRWMLHLSLLKLALRTAVVVAIFIAIALVIVWRFKPS